MAVGDMALMHKGSKPDIPGIVIFLALAGGDARQEDVYFRPMLLDVLVALDGDPTTMTLDELFRYEESDTRANRGTGRKECLEDPG